MSIFLLLRFLSIYFYLIQNHVSNIKDSEKSLKDRKNIAKFKRSCNKYKQVNNSAPKNIEKKLLKYQNLNANINDLVLNINDTKKDRFDYPNP